MKTKTNKPTNFFDYPMKIKKEIVSKTVENANKMQLETFNKTNNDWRDDLISLFIGMKLSMKNKLEIDDFISKIIQQQREEIIKEIEGKLQFLTRYERSKFRAHLEGPLEDELEIMLLEEDVKNLLEKK